MIIPCLCFFCLSLIYGLFSFFSFVFIGINSNLINTCLCCNNVWYNLLEDAILKLICCFCFVLFGYSSFNRLSNKNLSTDINLILLILASIATDGINLSLREKCLPENKNNCYELWNLSILNIKLLYYLKIPLIIFTILRKIIYHYKCKKYKFYYLLNNEFNNINNNIDDDTNGNINNNINENIKNTIKITTIDNKYKNNIELLQV